MKVLRFLRELPKRLLTFGPITRRFAKRRAFILLYHRILPAEACDAAKANEALNVSTEEFDAHLNYLKKHFDIVALSDLVQSLETSHDVQNKPKLAITFDDGWRDNYEHAWPLLKKHDVPATIFLVSDYMKSGGRLWWSLLEEHYESLGDISVADWASILAVKAQELGFTEIHEALTEHSKSQPSDPNDVITLFKQFDHQRLEQFVGSLCTAVTDDERDDLFTWEQAREMQGQCIEFGAHTERHEVLTHLEDQQIHATVEGSVDALKREGIDCIDTFSYPNGDTDNRVQKVVSTTGFEFAVGTKRGSIKRSKFNRMELPRINIGGGSKATIDLLGQRLAKAVWFPRSSNKGFEISEDTETEASEGISAAKLTAWTLTARIIGIFIRLTRNILLARILGPLERGVLNAIVTLIELVVLVIGFGLPTSAAYHAARDEHKKTFVPTLGLITAFFGIAVSLIVYALCHVSVLFRGFDHLVAPWALLASATSVFFFVRLVIHHYLVGSGRVISSNWLRLVESGLPLILFLLFIWLWRSDLPAAITSWTAGYAAVAIISIFIVLRLNPSMGRPNGLVGKSIVGFGLRSYWGNFFQVVIFRSDLLLISIMIGAEAVAFYAVAVVGAEMLLIFSEAGTTVATKMLLGGSSKEETARVVTTQNIARWTFYTMVPAGILLALTADFWIWLAFGTEFLPAGPALFWLVPGMVFLAVSGFVKLDLTGRGRPGWISVVLSICAVLNVSLNLLLIPQFGIVGAAMASSITYITMTLTYCVLFKYETSGQLSRFLVNFKEDAKAAAKVRKLVADRINQKRANVTD